MKTATKSYRQEPVITYPATVKSLDIRIPVSDENFGFEVKKAFDLAKSSGRELTVYFTAATADTAPV